NPGWRTAGKIGGAIIPAGCVSSAMTFSRNCASNLRRDQRTKPMSLPMARTDASTTGLNMMRNMGGVEVAPRQEGTSIKSGMSKPDRNEIANHGTTWTNNVFSVDELVFFEVNPI